MTPVVRPRKFVDLAHPGGVALGQVVVDGDDMNALAFEGVEIDGKGCDQGFAFTGFHFGDGAVVQHHAADHLHVEMAHAQGALGGFADRGEGRNEKVVQGLAGGQFGPETCGFGLQVIIREGGKFGFQLVDFLDGSRDI